ncbi:hypothetical protein [Agrococcus baldri]|uniref:Uncharacterized protein n=1 Tax=Agrococcus baldri TaxID=153730 RepID=A0AA87USV3_9MICO|nr:hypothetical protein [Agrococcus baldri]GEK81361.1 hypothetical protein ABA31_27120 [Agrococcus baldri]
MQKHEQQQDPFTRLDELLADPTFEPPSDDDLYGHLDADPLPDWLLEEHGLLAHELDLAVVEDVDWRGSDAFMDALGSFDAWAPSEPGVYDEAPVTAIPFDTLPAEIGAARTHVVVARRGGEVMLLVGPVDDFGAATALAHHAAKTHRRDTSRRRDSGPWAVFVLALPASLTWILRRPLYDSARWSLT